MFHDISDFKNVLAESSHELADLLRESFLSSCWFSDGRSELIK